MKNLIDLASYTVIHYDQANFLFWIRLMPGDGRATKGEVDGQIAQLQEMIDQESTDRVLVGQERSTESNIPIFEAQTVSIAFSGAAFDS